MTSTLHNPGQTIASQLQDDLRDGIWPRSVLVWYVGVWIALLLIRPWEGLFPSLGPLHVERIYAILGIILIVGAGKVRLCGSFQTTAVIGYLLAIAVSSLCAIQPSLAWDRLYVYTTLVVFYFILLSAVRTPYQLVFIAMCFVAVMAMYVGKAEYEYFVHGAHGFSMGVRRLKGIDTTYSHPNAVAGSIVLSLPFVLALWQVRKAFTGGWPPFWQKLFVLSLVCYVGLALMGIALTNSRSGMLCTALFVLLSAVTVAKMRIGRLLFALGCAGCLLAAIWAVMPEMSRERLRTVWDPEAGPESAHSSAQGRLVGLKTGLEMFRRFPVTGVGPGNFIPYRQANLDGVALVAHNTVGAVLSETGLVGGAAFALMCAGVFVNCRAVSRLAKGCPHPTVNSLSSLATACRNSLILMLFSGMFGDNQHRFQILWAAAFCLLAKMYAEEICAEEEARMVSEEPAATAMVVT